MKDPLRNHIARAVHDISRMRLPKVKATKVDGSITKYNERLFEPTDEYRFLLSPETQAALSQRDQSVSAQNQNTKASSTGSRAGGDK